MDYSKLKYAELRELCKKKQINPCSGKGITTRLLIKKLEAHDAVQRKNSKTANVRKSDLKIERATESGSYEGKKMPELRTLCKKRGLGPCFGKGITIRVLIEKLRVNDALIAENEKNLTSRPKTPLNPRKVRKKSFSWLDDINAVNDKILSITSYEELKNFCNKHGTACQRAEWGQLLQMKNAALHDSLQKMKSITSWQTLYMRVVDFFARFKSLSDLQFVTAKGLHRDYGDVWIAMVEVYAKIRRAAIEIGDIDVIKNVKLTESDARLLYPKSGSKETARFLFSMLPEKEKAWAFYTSLTSCNEAAADVMLENKILFDTQKALYASLSCETLLRRLILLSKREIIKESGPILKNFYLEGSAVGISEMVVLYPKEIIPAIKSFHVILLAKEDKGDALYKIVESSKLDDSVFELALETAALNNSLDAVTALIPFIQQLKVIKSFESALRMNRLAIAEKLFEFLDDETLTKAKQSLLESLHAEGKKTQVQKWASNVLKGII